MGKTLTRANIEYIKQAKAKRLTNAKIAEHVGCSIRCVQQYAKKLKDEQTPPMDKSADEYINNNNGLTVLARFREARDLLREQMLVAEARNIAQIVKEYRAVCEEVERMEAEVDEKAREQDEQQNDALAKAIATTFET